MKTYKVKNYKGNLVESLSKFQKSHKGMKIVEACEDGNNLKIKAEESEKLEEAVGKNVYVIINFDDNGADDGGVECMGAFSTLEKAKEQLALTFTKNGKRGNIEVDNDGQDDEYVVTANGKEKNIVIYEIEIDSRGMSFMTPYL